MSTHPAPHVFTVEEFHRMAESGVFAEDDRLELLDGQIVEMTPIGSRHSAAVARLTHLLTAAVRDNAIVSIQSPIHLDTHSQPQPDVALLRRRDDFYASAHAGPNDVLLVIEVADTTVTFDREVKLPLYARAGIPEVWIANLIDARIETYRGPGPDGYRQAALAQRGGTISAEAFTDAVFEVDAILG